MKTYEAIDNSPRVVTKSFRLTEKDIERLKRIAAALGFSRPLSEGRSVSIALKIADEKLNKQN